VNRYAGVRSAGALTRPGVRSAGSGGAKRRVRGCEAQGRGGAKRRGLKKGKKRARKQRDQFNTSQGLRRAPGARLFI